MTDSQGNQNNVVKVKKSDFEIIEALEDDGDAVKHKADAGKSSSELGKLVGSYEWPGFLPLNSI